MKGHDGPSHLESVYLTLRKTDTIVCFSALYFYLPIA